MRKIGYRAWLKEEKRFVYPKLIMVDFGTVAEISYNDIGISSDEIIERRLIIEDVVLEQFTGLRDKNRKRIYEGDIVEHDVYHVGVKAYRSKSEVFISDLGVRIREDKNDEECSQLRHCTNIEVVGNIHDNPELLEEAK